MGYLAYPGCNVTNLVYNLSKAKQNKSKWKILNLLYLIIDSALKILSIKYFYFQYKIMLLFSYK